MGDQMLSIAEEFSKFCSGRVEADGPNNGTKFRRTLLLPRLREVIASGDRLFVSMDGLLACGSSFLDSAFGGLVYDEGVPKKDINRHLVIVAVAKELQRYRDVAQRRIDVAKPA